MKACSIAVIAVFVACRPQVGNAQNADGFNPGPNDAVYAVLPQADGKILIGGRFTQVGAVPQGYLARLNSDGSVDSAFRPDIKGSNQPVVYSVVQQPDGAVLVGGVFSTVNGQKRTALARISAVGSVDPVFDPEPAQPDIMTNQPMVNCLAQQADGKIVVVGDFNTMKGMTRQRIARLNADGTLDAFVSSGYWSLYCLAIQPDGKILVGGNLGAVGGEGRGGLARLNPDGTLDFDFNPSILGGGFTFGSVVRCVAIQADGKIVVGGSFDSVGGTPCTNLARLNPDGGLDSLFSPSPGDIYSSGIYSIAFQTDGRILVAGDFKTMAGSPQKFLARLNADGSVDTSFTSAPNGQVMSVALQSDGAVLAAGAFSQIGGAERQQIGRLTNIPATQRLVVDSSVITWERGQSSPEAWRTTFENSIDGTNWTLLGTGTRVPNGWALTGVSLSPESTLRARAFLAGGFRDGSGSFAESSLGAAAISSQPQSRTNPATTLAVFNVGAAGSPPLTYQWLKNGSVLSVGGNISAVNTSTLAVSNVLGADAGSYQVIVSNTSGAITSAVASLTVIDPYIAVQPLNQTVQPGQTASIGVVAVGTAPLSYQWFKSALPLAGQVGSYLSLQNVQRSDAADYNVVVSSPYGLSTSSAATVTVNLTTFDPFNPHVEGYLSALGLQGDGRFVLGGTFATIAGEHHESIARFNTDGTIDSGFTPRDGTPWAFAAQPDGCLLVAGYVGLYGQQTSLGRLNPDGTLDTSFNAGATYPTYALAVQEDKKILVGGNFLVFGSEGREAIARLNSDGTLDSPFFPWPDGAVACVALQADGRILIGGDFSTVGSNSAPHIARLYTDGTVDSTFEGGTDGQVNSIAVLSDGRLMISGAFTNVDGLLQQYLARLNNNGTLDTTFRPIINSVVNCLAVQTDGKIIIGGYFSAVNGNVRLNIARLNADGTVDSTFDPGADSRIYLLALDQEGRVLTDGYLALWSQGTTLTLRRINNTDPAINDLLLNGSTLKWFRGGTSAEFWRTSFEATTNGTDWTILGSGTKVPEGWQLTGVTVMPSTTIRGRGFVSGTAWFFEKTLYPSQPRIMANDSSFGFNAGKFGFNFTGSPGQTVVVQGSADLVHWTPLFTNTLTAIPAYFKDTSSGVPSSRFYRLMSQ